MDLSNILYSCVIVQKIESSLSLSDILRGSISLTWITSLLRGSITLTWITSLFAWIYYSYVGYQFLYNKYSR